MQSNLGVFAPQRQYDAPIKLKICYGEAYHCFTHMPNLALISELWWVQNKACLDQLLIAIRSFTLLCDQNRSQARLITIMKLIAKLGIIYATACHASICTAALDCLSVSCHCGHCRRTALTTIYKHGTGRGRWELGRQLQQQLALWVCLKWVHAAT